MSQYNQHRHHQGDLKTPVRNRYYYGKLLDVFHLEMEQEYYNAKRLMLNRLVTGPGVVCGLDVELADNGDSVIVLPGVAIDRCGREIIVPNRTEPLALPPRPPHPSDDEKEEYRQKKGEHGRRDECDDEYAHVLLCYHECESDPAPVMAGDCETVTLCASGSIREQYKVEVRAGYASERRSNFPDVIEGRRIGYNAIVDYVTRACRPLPDDCCIPLANIRLRDSNKGWVPEADIYVRPIVYTNRLLWDLIQSLVNKGETGY